MDDFEKAILFTFDQTGAIDDNLKAQAITFCAQAKQSPTIVQACLDRFPKSHYAEVQFWCLQTLEEIIRHRYAAVNPQERQLTRSSLMAALCDSSSDEGTQQSRQVFVRNKLAQIIVLLICIEYPAEWPSLFLDLLSVLPKGPAAVDMFCRILTSLDEEIISLDYPRNQEEISVAMRIKDAMRQQCIRQIAEAWYNLVVMYRNVNQQLASLVLQVMQRYITWIDISLVVNDSFIPLLFEILTSSSGIALFRGAAADCLLAIVLKRMDPTSKLILLQQLQLGQVCSQVVETRDSDFASKLTDLLTGVGTELIECSKKVECNGASVSDMLDEVLPSIFYLMQHGNEDVSATTFQFLSSYIARIKVAGMLSEKQAVHVNQILEAIRYRMRYDSASMESIDLPDKDGEEEEDRMGEYRKDLFVLFRGIYRVAPVITINFVKTSLATALRNPDTSFEDIEAALTLLYVLGEGMVAGALNCSGGDIQEMLEALLSMKVPCHSHRLISLIYLETLVRYVKYVEQHSDWIPSVLMAFVDARGIHHPNPHVSSRANYLFMRLVKALRSQLAPYLDGILQNLQDRLSLPKDIEYKAKTGTLEDRSYAYEAVGLLIGMEELSQETQEKFLSALLGPLCTQINDMLSSEVSHGDLVGSPTTTAILQQIVQAVSYLSKGFSEQMITRSRPALGNIFKQIVDVILRIFTLYPKNRPLRSKIVSFLHRMVDTLGSGVFPYLPTAIRGLLPESEPGDLVEFIQLINQLINKFKHAMVGILEEVTTPIIDRVFMLLPKSGLPEGPNTEELRELQELQKAFFVFLHSLVSSDLSRLLLNESTPCLNEILQLLLDASNRHNDVLVRKICIQVLAKLITEWCGNTEVEEKIPGFRHFVLERFARDCIYNVLQSSFNLQDANTVTLLGEIGSAQRIMYEKCGEEFLMQMATKILPSAHCPPNLAEQYCLHMQRSDGKDLKAFYKSFIEKLRPEYNNNVVAR